jgi:hypothetical protein
MPDTEEQIITKLAALQSIRDGGTAILFSEIVKLGWGQPDGEKVYCFTQIDEIPGFKGIAALVPYNIDTRIIVKAGAPFIKLERSGAGDDDKADLEFSDIDGEMSRLTYEYGQGIRVQVYSYYPQVDLLLEDWTGTLGAPKEADGVTLKIPAVAGYRSPKLLLPHRIPATSCQFLFGGLMRSQAEIDAAKGCPFNAHLTDEQRGGAPLIGVPGFTDCPRAVVGDCTARLVTARYWPAFNTIIEGIANNQTKGPNLIATAIGNEGALSDPIRMFYGYRMLKGLRVLAFRPENNTNHPDKGFIAGLFEISEGPVLALWNFYMNGALVGLEHQNIRFGELGQPPTFFSPNVNSYSGTAHAFGRVQGDYRNANASSLTATIFGHGFRDVRVYSDVNTFTEQYDISPTWCVGDMLTRKRCAYGEDYARYNIQSMIDCAAWHAETVAFQDPNGNLFTGTRSTFNAEVSARSTQQQIYDACVAARMAEPFMWAGKKHFYPLKKETIDGSIPVFTTVGPDANICIGGNKRPAIKWSYTGDDELVNQVVVNYDAEDNSFAQTSLTFGDQPQQLRAGRAWNDTTIRIIPKTYPALGITNMSEAARLGNLLLYLGPLDAGGIRNNLKVTFTTWFSRALRIKPYQLVQLIVPELERFGFDYFRVMKITRQPDLQVELEVQAYPVDYYERMEDVTQPPPVVVGAPQPNPGGRRGEQPEPILPLELSHTGDRITGRFAESIF